MLMCFIMLTNGKMFCEKVNNAGMDIMKPATEHTMEDYSALMSTNFESCFHLSKLAHPFLKGSGNGNIVFMSSVCGQIATALLSLYSATKGN